MKFALRQFIRIAAAAGALALVSCIDGREEYWLNADRSGRADVSYTFPATAAKLYGGATGVEKSIEKALAGSHAFTATSCEVTAAGDRLTAHVTASFASVTDLEKVGESGTVATLPAAARGLAGEISAGRTGRSLEFSRTIEAGLALPGAMFYPRSKLAGHSLTYIVHLPVVAAESNATRSADGGRTLVWELPLAKAVRGPELLSFTAPIPISGGMWAAAGAGGIVLVAALLWLARKVAGAGQRKRPTV